MDGGAWWATVHGVTKSRTRLIDFTISQEGVRWKPQYLYDSALKVTRCHLSFGSGQLCSMWEETPEGYKHREVGLIEGLLLFNKLPQK